MIDTLKDNVHAAGLWLFRLPPVRFAGSIMKELGDDNVALVSGGIAFYAFLSIFPGIAFALMLWGIFTDGADLSAYLSILSSVVPGDAYSLISDQMTRISSSQQGDLSWGAIVTLLLALWSASRAMNALLMALSVTYKRETDHGFIKQNLLALGFTLGGILFSLLSLAAIGAVPPLLEALRLGSVADILIRFARWVFILGLFFGGIYVLYRTVRPKATRLGPEPSPVFIGAALAASIWFAASFGFSFYLAEFASYNETFGSLGAVAALLMWFFISSFAICIGAEVNAKLGDARRLASTRKRQAPA